MSLHGQTYCIPQTQSYCCSYGITHFSLPGITQFSEDGIVGFEDFTALVSENIEGNPIPFSIITGGIEPHDVRVWIDANNDGTFSHPQELVFESLSTVSPSGHLSLPSNILFSNNLRLRIIADFAGSLPLPCSAPTFGQAEDYSFKLLSSGTVPTADFHANTTTSCNGVVYFSSTSTGNPAHFFWDFGDGHISIEENPNHTYSTDGIYDIRLIVANSVGADTMIRTDYVYVTLSETCDTFHMPAQGTATILYSCNYVLTDNGGNNNYTDNTDGVLTLSTVWAEQMCLRFSEFHFEKEFDYLEIYDGPNPASPIIGRYTGQSIPPEFCSSGKSLCLKQVSDDIVNYSGFVAQVLCTAGIMESYLLPSSIYPNPFTDLFTVFVASEEAWHWDLLDLSGRIIISADEDTDTAIIDARQLTAGMYVLRLQSKNKIWQHKVVKAE